MATRKGFDFSGVTLLTGEQPEEKRETTSNIANVSILGQEQEEPIEGPVMKAYDAPWYEDVRDFASGVKDHLAHGDSFSVLHNLWKAVFTPKEAVPEYDDEGNLIGTRLETQEELQERIPKHRELIKKQYGLDDDSAEALTAKIGSIFIDPTTYMPLGQSYKGISASVGGLAGLDTAAFELANDGKIDPADVAIATSLGAILGPAMKLVGDKAVAGYKALRARGKTHVESVKEIQRMLPAPEKMERLPAPDKPQLLPSPDKGDIPFFVDKSGDVVSGPFYGYKRGLREIEYLPAEVASKQLEKETRATSKLINHFNQGGGINQNLMYHIASTGVGATIGGALDGKEGAAYGAAIGFGSPLVWRHAISKPIGKLSQWASHDAAGHFARGKFASSPSATLKTFGKSGRSLADNLDRMHENIDMAVGNKLFQFDKTFKHLNKTQLKTVRGLLNHTIKPSQAKPVEVAAAKQLRREFNQVLDDAVNAGIITAKKATKLKGSARSVGYFPRIYDTDKLASKAGKEEWIKTWTEFTGNERDLTHALESIVGDADIVGRMVKGSKGNLTRKQALDLLRLMRNRNNNTRSVHLEKSRKINENAEEILRPFLIDDPHAAIARYFNDAYRRIEASKVFGAQVAPKTKKGLPKWNPDAQAERLIERIGKEHGLEAEKVARETFLSSVGDQNANIIQKYMDLGDLEGRVLRGLGGFETGAKLGIAQTANMWQATVNGMTRLLKISGNPVSSLRLYTKGVMKGLGTDGAQYADRIGAALETTLMEIAGESSKIGKFGEGVLKYSGFITAEKWQRRLGANMGRVYAEELAEKFIRIQKGALKGRAAKKVLAQMDELGLPTHRTITSTDIDRAGLRFSNDINFRNTPDKLPLAWQTPYGRLMTKFKSFAFHQSRFVKNNVIKPLLKGNPWPLTWYLSGSAGIGMGIDEVRRLIKGDDRDLSETERYLRGITMVGGMGILQDTISQFHRSPEQGLASLAGPAPGDVGKLLHGGIKTVENQDPEAMLNAITRLFVFPGQKHLIEEIGNEGRTRGARSSSRGGSRGSSR